MNIPFWITMALIVAVQLAAIYHGHRRKKKKQEGHNQ